MKIKEIEARSILRKHGKIDSWFLSRYGMNLYRGCLHNCVYCDGRAESYYVEGEFGVDIEVKANAVDILRKELDPRRKRKPLRPGFILLGGGVGDSYQPAGENYNTARRVLELIQEFEHPVHILTKSTSVLKDLDLLKRINDKKKVIVSFSFSGVDNRISAFFEPGVPSPRLRLQAISTLKQEGFSCGMYLLPVLPFITDSKEQIEASISKASEAGVDFVIFGGLTLKAGRQQDYFLSKLKQFDPGLLPDYSRIYRGNPYGAGDKQYYDSIHRHYLSAAVRYKMPVRMPLEFFRDRIDKDDLVIVLLEHIDYFLKLRGEKSPYGYAAYSLSQVKEPLSGFKSKLTSLKGVGPVTAKLVGEILSTGTCSYYERLRNAPA